MKPLVKLCLPAVALLAMAACSSNGASTVPTTPVSGGNNATLGFHVPVLPGQLPANVRFICDHNVPAEFAHCDSQVRTDLSPDEARVAGYGPADLQLAYNLPSATKGKGQTIGIVDAFDDPNAEADLQVYRSNFSLPTCDTSNGCFAKLNQLGQVGPYPAGNSGWAGEISLDLDMVSATCPNCHIVLIESNDNSFKNLGISVDTAIKNGANAVSNSYSGGLTKKVRKRYDHPGHIILASAGDNGYPIGTPAGYPSVISVGGTTMRKSSGSRPFTETVWRGTGSGCTTYTKPTYQSDTGCAGRTSNDVAAVADPATGVAVYDTYQSHGWQVFGGTSVSSPLIGGVYGLAGNESKMNYGQSLYTNAKDLFDVTSGTNGTCNPAYLCTGEVGYDGPTGNGTPNGTKAF